jgi:transposase-like protein
MHRRTWDAQTKALIVLEGLKGQPIAEICTEHQISPSLYAQWQDRFLAHAASAFELPQHTRREVHLAQEHTTLKQLVGELFLEFKKSDERLG